MNYPENIIVHHTAVSYDKNPDQYEATNNYHINLGWGMIGYHYEIAKNGKLYTGRVEEMVGAHTKEKGMNYKSIGICMDGNFDIEYPTEEQQKTLKELILDIMERYTIPEHRIFPHRHFATYKSCYGSKLSNNWVRDLIKGPNTKYMFKLIKTSHSPDVYSLYNRVVSKIANEYTLGRGTALGYWNGEIEEVASIGDYKLGEEMMFSPMDKS